VLENLDKIDWSNLGHAYGPADDVPELLRSLASDDEDERSNAIYELHGNIWHQGTIYQATAHAVPFLLELLESPKVEDRHEILVLLADLACGTSYHDVHQHLLHRKEEANEQEWQEKIHKELGWVSDVKAAVRAGENLYLGFLNDVEVQMRDAAAYLLASLDRPSAKLAEAIWKRLEKEKKESVQVSLVLAFGMLAEHTEANTGSLLAMLLSSPSKSVKLAAAMSLIQLSPSEQSSDSIAVLVNAGGSPENFDAFDRSIWGQVDGVELLVLNHTTQLEGNAARAGESALVSVLSTPSSTPPNSHSEAHRIAVILLTVAFPQSIQRDATFASLNEQQQRVAKLIARTPEVWAESTGQDKNKTFRISMKLRSCGLPDKPDRLYAFVSGEPMRVPIRIEQKRSGIGERLKSFFRRGGRW
jgi:hypothetical protein